MRQARSNRNSMKVSFFKSSSDFRRWLDAKHRKVRELWVGFYKKSASRPSITYPEAVSEALCYGWIDGVRRSVDPGSYTVRFTPRKPNSQWSAVNIKRARELVDAGRMRPAGLKTFEGAVDQPRAYSYEQRRDAVLDQRSERQFRANPSAWEFFQAQPPSYRRTCAFWVTSAKREETQAKRLATLIADSERGEIVKPLRRPPVPKRPEKVQ
jgi:uncharacterized protein YdeI (YjbR/CyaY-like superfamily)